MAYLNPLTGQPRDPNFTPLPNGGDSGSVYDPARGKFVSPGEAQGDQVATPPVRVVPPNPNQATPDNPNPPGGTPTPNSDVANRSAWLSNVFQSFGYTPTAEELQSFMGIAGGTVNDLTRGRTMVANYVNTVRQMQDANANDPSKQILADEKGFFNDTQAKAAGFIKDSQGLYQQAKDLSSQAPKLFGSMTPEQIDAYLAPLKNELDAGKADTEGASARRGLAGSSTELNALAGADAVYKENVIKSGLDIGLQEQQQQEALLTGEAGTLMNSGITELGQLPGISNQIATTGAGISKTLQDQALLKGEAPLNLTSTSTLQAKAA